MDQTPPPQPSGKNASVEGRDENEHLGPMEKFRSLARRLAQVTPEELRVQQEKWEADRVIDRTRKGR